MVKTAESNGAGDDITSALRGLSDVRFNTPADVTEAVNFSTNQNS